MRLFVFSRNVSLLLLLVITGCGEGFDPIVEEDGYFSVTGYLDARADTQFVRLNALRTRVLISDSLEADVRTVHVETGASVRWQDSLVQLENGRLGHLYYGIFTPKPGQTWRLRVTRDGIRPAEGVTDVPPEPELEPGEIEDVIVGLDTDIVQIVYWQDLVGRISDATVTYVAEHPQTGEVASVTIEDPARGEGSPMYPSFVIQIERDRVDVLNALNLGFDGAPPILHEIRMDLVILSRDWGNGIEGGVGSFGSVMAATGSWLPPVAALDSVGYALPDSLQ